VETPTDDDDDDKKQKHSSQSQQIIEIVQYSLSFCVPHKNCPVLFLLNFLELHMYFLRPEEFCRQTVWESFP
jgi:hypothetical protein